MRSRLPRSMSLGERDLEDPLGIADGFASFFPSVYQLNVSTDSPADLLYLLRTCRAFKPLFTQGPDNSPSFLVADSALIFVVFLIVA